MISSERLPDLPAATHPAGGQGVQFLGYRPPHPQNTAGHVDIGAESGASRREDSGTVILHKIPFRECCVRTGEKHIQCLHFLKNSFADLMWSAGHKDRCTRPPLPHPCLGRITDNTAYICGQIWEVF